MADISSISSSTDELRKTTSFPRLFTLKNYSETVDSMMSSPTSILDTKPFFPLKNPFFSDPNSTPKSPDSNPKRTWDKGIGLGIVDALNDDDENLNLINPFSTKLSKPESRMVLFGSQLKIQVPNLPPYLLSPTESPKSPADFGIKTRNPQLGSFSSSSGFSHCHSPAKKSGNSGMDTPGSPRVFNRCLSAIEMELSEDYTCVISYGPNPKTTHIFDDCVIESCCGIVEFSGSKTEDSDPEFLPDGSSYPSENFLSSCFTCKKNLGHGKDIYMYRGEKAFCSRECRYQEMMLEEEMNKMDTEEDIYGPS